MNIHLYNEIEPYANEWLFNLMLDGEIPAGKIDARPIQQLDGRRDFDGVRQFHTFAGIGGWPLALRLAGWPEDREVWTGSCPCQPFSVAGKRGGVSDERHLWPMFRDLIAIRRPATIFGEQVASSDGRLWLAGVRTDLEALGYRVGAADLCAAGVGAPHIRQRLYWVADAIGPNVDIGPKAKREAESLGRSSLGGLAYNNNKRLEGLGRTESQGLGLSLRSGEVGGVRHSESNGRESRWPESGRWGSASRCGSDGKKRRIEPGIEPLADGVPRRMDKLRGYGNAIVPPLAAEFIMAYMETL